MTKHAEIKHTSYCILYGIPISKPKHTVRSKILFIQNNISTSQSIIAVRRCCHCFHTPEVMQMQLNLLIGQSCGRINFCVMLFNSEMKFKTRSVLRPKRSNINATQMLDVSSYWNIIGNGKASLAKNLIKIEGLACDAETLLYVCNRERDYNENRDA